MLTPNARIKESIIETLDHLLKRRDLPPDVIFDLNVVAVSIRHLQHIGFSEGTDMREYGRQSYVMLQSMQHCQMVCANRNPMIKDVLRSAGEAALALSISPSSGNALKQHFLVFLDFIDKTFSKINALAPDIATPLFSNAALHMLEQHCSVKMFGQYGENIETAGFTGDALTESNLTAYFQQRLADPTAKAEKLVTLPGGFGKETSLFTLASKTLNADLVVRRDAPSDPWEGLDCHIASNEYPLLKAVHARGFPIPEPLFFEANSKIIKGPAFTVMRRAPGSVCGDATSGKDKIAAELQRTLAQIVARLHTVAPLTELAGISAFEASLWTKTAGDCTRTYIGAWFNHYLTATHQPFPTLHGMFHWLVAHLPDAKVPSTLVHGDIGFHNLLFNEGQLSAVLDWEFGHIGDPAEDLGYIRSVMGDQLDWPQFVADYGEAGRPIPGEQRIAFFEIWSHVRNTAASALGAGHFEEGRLRNARSNMVTLRFVPHFVARAEALIANYKGLDLKPFQQLPEARISDNPS